MADVRTRPTLQSADEYIAAIGDPARQAEAKALLKLMRRATGQKPVMWGPSIVGFGKYRYTYSSGRSGESCAAGFSVRKADLGIYLVASGPSQPELLARLGKHRMGKACLSIKRLADVDPEILERLVAGSYQEVRRRYG